MQRNPLKSPSPRPEASTFLPFLRRTQEEHVRKHGKKGPDVPTMLAARTLRPYFDLSPTKGFDLIDPTIAEAATLRQDIIDALAKPYGTTSNTCARPVFRSLLRSESWNDLVDCPAMPELIGLADAQLEYLGDPGLAEELTARLRPLEGLVKDAVAATLPNSNDFSPAVRQKLDFLRDGFTAWTMAIVYAVAYATAVDDHAGFVLFAPLARYQLRGFMTGIDPYAHARTIVVYVH